MSPDTLQSGCDTSLRPTGNRVRDIRGVLCCLLDVLSYLCITFFQCCPAVLEETQSLTSESKPTGGAAGRTLDNDLLLWIDLVWACGTEEQEEQQQQPRSFLMSHFF